MAKGYIIVTQDVKDRAGLEAYGAAAFPTLMAHGATPLVVSDNVEAREGGWHGQRTVVLEFASVDAARKWYESDEYQAVIGLRLAAADCHCAIVEGFDMPG